MKMERNTLLSPWATLSRSTCSGNPNWSLTSAIQRLSCSLTTITILATMRCAHSAVNGSSLVHQQARACPLSMDRGRLRRSRPTSRTVFERTSGTFIVSAAFMQMMSRRVLTESRIELDDKVRCKNPSNADENVHLYPKGESRSGSLTRLELMKPGMASKNFSSKSSSPSVPNVQFKIRRSITDDCFHAVPSAASSKPPTNHL
ncbi:hypothetical protein BJV74DRAFT_860212 [Russula compacta]|nr:hypothetical protein BJV74DRAFT_860212 [Russula compacta]